MLLCRAYQDVVCVDICLDGASYLNTASVVRFIKVSRLCQVGGIKAFDTHEYVSLKDLAISMRE
jgi:hypothetical protein